MNSQKAKIFIWSVIAAGAIACAIAVYNLPFGKLDFRFALLAIFTIVFGSRLSLQMPRSKVHFSTNDALVFLTFLLYGGEIAILVATIETVFASLKMRRSGVKISARTLLFNSALMACAIGGTYFTFGIYSKASGGTIENASTAEFVTLMGMMALVSFAVNSFLASVFTAFKANISIWRAWNDRCLGSSVTYIAGAAFAGIMYKMIEYFNIFTFIIAALIVVIVYLTYRSYIGEIQKSLEQAEQAEREKAEAEAKRREEAELHIAELSKHIAEQDRIGEALRLSKERFRHAALHDALTGLPNRSFFTEQIKYLLDTSKNEQRQGFCVLFIDLDRFKNINDSLGHAIGDELLVLVGRRLENIIRQGDMVSRLGGDEFAIVLVGISNPDDAVKFAERIHETVAQPFRLHGHQVFSAPSIGIAMSSHEYTQPDDLLRDADIAMYHAKERNIGCALFDRDLRAKAVNILKIETDLRYAVEREELRVFYQPIIALETGRLAGFEALVRWQHPERGLVSPGEFIPVAEDTGLIVPMTLWILRESCTQLSQWRWRSPLNRALLVSVNLSGKHFGQPDLVEQVRDILQETGLDPHCLKLEITESAVMENAENTTRILNDLRTLGVQLSIDDFGTGYSSLSYLHRFPIDTLKIDRSFVSRMGQAGENSEIVKTIITLAKNLEMEVIAEGVETVEQLRQLRDLGCRYAQGFLFSRPQPQADMDKLMKEKTNWLPDNVEVIVHHMPSNVIQLRQ